jgi:hypothetical protein
MKLTQYNEFIDRVDELGFMALGWRALPALFEEATAHIDDPERDAWCWKDRAAKEKRLAFGSILGKHKGFVSARMYPLFYAAYRPVEPMEVLWEKGQISRTTWELWLLFEAKTSLSTDEIRQEMGVTRKMGGSRVDASVEELQRTYHITVAGNRRKISSKGEPYGWPSCIYEVVDSWTPPDWKHTASEVTQDEAREIILDRAMAMASGVDKEELAEGLGFKRSL